MDSRLLLHSVEISFSQFSPHKLLAVSSQLVLLFALSGYGHAETLKLSQRTVDENSQRIIIQWPQSVPSFKAEVEDSKLTPINVKKNTTAGDLRGYLSTPGKTRQGKNIILRFSKPIQTPGIESFEKEILPWIKSIRSGYDSFLIQTFEPAEFQVLRGKSEIVVQVKRLPSKLVQRASSQNREFLHLESDLLLQTNKFEAHAGLTEMLKAHPNDPKILADLATVEERLGRWRQAMQHYDSAFRLNPNDLDSLQSKSYLHGRFGPQVRVDQYYRDTEDNEIQWVSQAMARQSFASDFMIGVGFENRILDDNVIRPRITGALQRFEGDHYQWNAYVEKDHTFSATRLSILGQEGQLGGSLQHRHQLPIGELSLAGIYHEPYWEFVEGFADEGTADRVKLQWVYEDDSPILGKYKSKNPFSGSVGVSFNRYGVQDKDNVAESIKLLAELRYQIIRQWPWFSVGYQFNSEYVDLTDSRIDSAGFNFNPLPIENTQTHSFDVSVTNHITRKVRFDLTSGYKLDNRVDSNGPFVIFDFIYDSLSNLEVGINVEFNQETVRGSSNTFTQVGGFLTWKL